MSQEIPPENSPQFGNPLSPEDEKFLPEEMSLVLTRLDGLRVFLIYWHGAERDPEVDDEFRAALFDYEIDKLEKLIKQVSQTPDHQLLLTTGSGSIRAYQFDQESTRLHRRTQPTPITIQPQTHLILETSERHYVFDEADWPEPRSYYGQDQLYVGQKSPNKLLISSNELAKTMCEEGLLWIAGRNTIGQHYTYPLFPSQHQDTQPESLESD